MAKFVVVDDSKIARSFLKDLIEGAGHEIVGEGSNGLEGYDLYSQYEPDAITLDVTMPLVSGVDCLRNIMKNFPDATVIMVTSVGKEKLVEEVKQIGAKAVMKKPFEKEDALNVINSLVLSK
jgi:two-component system chemotaxis response regulator CheY